MEKEFDYLVVGSGVTGMTISLLLADCGFRVLLLEKSSVIGGSMQRFWRNGIPFDTGFHFTAALTGCMGDMVRMLKFSPPLETVPIRTNLYLADRKKLFHLPRGRSRVRDYFCSLFPEEAEKIRMYFETEKRIFENTPLFNLREDGFAVSGALDEDFITLKAYLDSLEVSGEVRSLLASFTSCHGTPCGEISLANHCRVSFGLLDDMVRVKGSGGAFVDAFRRRAKELGIEIRTRCTIRECVEEEGLRCHQVRLTDGTLVTFRDCVMTIHPHAVAEILPEKFRSSLFLERIREFEEGCGFFTLFGVLEKPCGSFCQELTSSFSTSDIDLVMTPDHPEATATGIMLTEETGADGALYRTVTAFENVFAPETAEWSGSVTGKRNASYGEYKQRKIRQIERKIYELYPEFEGALRILDSASMLTYRDYLSPYGSAYGIRQKMGQHNLFGKLPIRNFYVAGQSALLPGAMGAMLSAFVIWRKMVGEELYLRKINEVSEGKTE